MPKIKKIVTIPEAILNTISGLIPNILNISINCEAGEYDVKAKTFLIKGLSVDFNLK